MDGLHATLYLSDVYAGLESLLPLWYRLLLEMLLYFSTLECL